MTATAPAPASTATSTPTSPWAQGPLFDGFFLLSGLWLSALSLVLFSLSGNGVDDDKTPLSRLGLALTLAFWIGHRISSPLLAWLTSSYRPLLRAQPGRFVVAPLLVFVAVLVWLVPADDMLWPWPRSTRLWLLVALDYAWVTQHFAAQHTGVLSLYRGRAGLSQSPQHRSDHRLYAYVVGGGLVVVAEVLSGMAFVPDAIVQALSPFAGALSGIAVFVVVLALASLVWRERSTVTGANARTLLPRALYLASLALMVSVAFVVDPLVFLLVWTAQHWLVAVGLALRVARVEREAPASSSLPQRALSRVLSSPALLLLVLIAASALLFPVFQVEATTDGSRLPQAQELAGVVVESALTPWLVALGFATAFVHYLMDRAVFRFRDPAVRHAARGLWLP